MKIYFSLPLLLLLTLLIASCEKEEDAPATSQGMLQIEDTRYELTRGAMIYIEEVFHSDDPSLKYNIDLILYTQGISVEGADLSVNYTEQGQRKGITFPTTCKTEFVQGTFSLNSPNLIHMGYFAD